MTNYSDIMMNEKENKKKSRNPSKIKDQVRKRAKNTLYKMALERAEKDGVKMNR